MTELPSSLDDVQAAVQAVRERTDIEPEVGLVLGSGLGALAEAADDAVIIDAADLPGYPHSSVEGHSGRLVIGHLEGRPVIFVQGRVHLYEGLPVRDVAFPVRLLRALGATRLLVTNAAGGINPTFHPGTLMFIADHLNMTFGNPVMGGATAGRHPRAGAKTATPYDPDWIDRAEREALERGIATTRGTYIWTKGPSYETKAEVSAFGRIGADAVGMSTVPEVLQARALDMQVLGISTITNYAAGLSTEHLDHEEVLEIGRQVRGDLEQLVRAIVAHT